MALGTDQSQQTDFWSANPEADVSTGSWLSEEEKQELAASAETFDVLHMALLDKEFQGKPAKVWDLEIVSDRLGERTLSFGSNPQRDEIFKKMYQWTHHQGGFSARLVYIKPKSGNAFWALAKPLRQPGASSDVPF